MDMSKKHLTWAGAGLLLALTVGSPAVADDVELLLSTPAASDAAKPNILFILDSSGSMTTLEESQEPFDPNKDYSDRGDCKDNYYYWTFNSGIPTCGDDFRFKQNVFQCQQGRLQLDASGSYTDTMAMYRPNDNGNWRWRQPSKNETERAVECKEDSGVHGANNNPSPRTYARTGSNRNAYASNPNREVSWGTTPTHRIVTVYDPNFLNWYHNPPSSSMRRTDIVKAVTKNVLGSVNDVNVGVMRFNFEQGGPVVQAIKDLDDNRDEINTVVDNLPANGWTPLSETMYEAALYFRGLPAFYGDEDNTDEDAVVDDDDPLIYKRPAEYACSKNFIVMLTDGEPLRDTDAYFRAPTLPNFSTVTGRGSCTGGNVNGACLDDIAEYLAKGDVNPVVPGDQQVTTYTIGFTVDLPLLKSTAEVSGGEYYLASDVKSLTAALTDIVTDIFDKDISFTAPAIAVNAYNRTQHLNDLYVSVFRASDEVHWPGNMKKFTIKNGQIEDAKGENAVDKGFFSDNARNFWNRDDTTDGPDVEVGGAANYLPDPGLRRVFTNNSLGNLAAPTNAIDIGNKGMFEASDFGLSGKEGEPSLEEMLDWMRGADVEDELYPGVKKPRYQMGDTLHSQPAAVVYGNFANTQDVVVFNATNDGYLHALDADTGDELWSFVPKELLVNMADLYANENVDYKNYGIDGDVVPVVKDKNGNGIIEAGDDFVYLIFGMRRGGDNYYMIDVTDRNNPQLRWVKNYPQFGQTWSAPVVAKVDVNSGNATGNDDAVLIFGAGYDTSHDSPAHPAAPDLEGAGIFMLDLETGQQIWRAGVDNGANLRLNRDGRSMIRAIPSRIAVLDLNGDQYADRMYAVDVSGQVFRFDIFNEETPNNLVTGGVIAQLGAEGAGDANAANTRRFYNEPDISMFTDPRQGRRYLSINLGSGYRAGPLDNSAEDRFFSIRDPNVFTKLSQIEYNNYDIVTDDDLVEVAGTAGKVIPPEGDGWRFTLPPNEKVLSTARTFDNEVFFVSFEPTVDSDEPCQAGLSVNRLYRVSVLNGDPVIPLDEEVDLEPEDIDDARITRLEQGGIAPQPVFLFPGAPENCTGDECTPPPLACVGVECFDPGFPNNPVRTLWTQDGVE